MQLTARTLLKLVVQRSASEESNRAVDFKAGMSIPKRGYVRPIREARRAMFDDSGYPAAVALIAM